VPLTANATPVGDWIKAVLFARQTKFDPMTVELVIRDTCPEASETSIRTTVHNPTGGVLFRPLGLFRALETNRSPPERVITANMSQGPLIFALDHVSATWQCEKARRVIRRDSPMAMLFQRWSEDFRL